MREIKFRVFSHLTKEFLKIDSDLWEGNGALYNGLGFFGGNEITIEHFYDGSSEEVYTAPLKENEFAVSEFTGLKDSKGVEIYEGDIIELESIVYLVAHDDENACYVLQTMRRGELKNDRNFNGHAASVCKVVGNVYENPELLEK